MMKRFWTEVTIDRDRAVMLDARPVRTPGRRALALPTNGARSAATSIRARCR
jgi:chaperone required for assembly of F1-ATPase